MRLPPSGRPGNPSPPRRHSKRLDVDDRRRDGGRRHPKQRGRAIDDPLPCRASPGPPSRPAPARPPRHSRSARRRTARRRRSAAARQSTNSTTRNPRRTGGVVGRGGGSSKPKSCGLNEAISRQTPAHTPQARLASTALSTVTLQTAPSGRSMIVVGNRRDVASGQWSSYPVVRRSLLVAAWRQWTGESTRGNRTTVGR